MKRLMISSLLLAALAAPSLQAAWPIQAAMTIPTDKQAINDAIGSFILTFGRAKELAQEGVPKKDTVTMRQARERFLEARTMLNSLKDKYTEAGINSMFATRFEGSSQASLTYSALSGDITRNLTGINKLLKDIGAAPAAPAAPAPAYDIPSLEDLPELGAGGMY